MNIASVAHMCVVCVRTRVHGRVYQTLGDSIKRQTSSLESGVQADRSSPQETGLKGREMLRSVTGEIEYSDNGNHLLAQHWKQRQAHCDLSEERHRWRLESLPSEERCHALTSAPVDRMVPSTRNIGSRGVVCFSQTTLLLY